VRSGSSRSLLILDLAGRRPNNYISVDSVNYSGGVCRESCWALFLASAFWPLQFPLLRTNSVSAEFDTTKTISFTGKVKEVNWGNPHILHECGSQRSRFGKACHFRVEGGAPNALFRAGWRKDTLKIGETVRSRAIAPRIRIDEHRPGNDSLRKGQKVFAARTRPRILVALRTRQQQKGQESGCPFFFAISNIS